MILFARRDRAGEITVERAPKEFGSNARGYLLKREKRLMRIDRNVFLRKNRAVIRFLV